MLINADGQEGGRGKAGMYHRGGGFLDSSSSSSRNVFVIPAQPSARNDRGAMRQRSYFPPVTLSSSLHLSSRAGLRAGVGQMCLDSIETLRREISRPNAACTMEE